MKILCEILRESLFDGSTDISNACRIHDAPPVLLISLYSQQMKRFAMHLGSHLQKRIDRAQGLLLGLE
jgi:hypothetical protein